ncbi:sulfide:quinone oxidoreductase, mitochondrial [Eurytemora carolleeae]|uniref:sulfide:quinone oxidoreductase, mitochondrial n=1 Tax=Eurytemora carolleeae TaxID=1294199 RepID=UPI000C782994|nr:sulfide:quinone oxidoreductase, mitochondrial [Eurytemora carolleeae]|eukprot:XP_023345046.1 sulfide:quinone oxidoreductase, mitochondrial-like [Eurytemora affinis]
MHCICNLYRYDKIKGLPEAFETPGVCSNYSPLYVEKTTKAIKEFKAGGDAVFTLPNSPIKCAGAPQKILYIAEETFRLQGKPANMVYYTALPVIFGVKKYADALWKVVKERGINVNLRHDLIEVKPDTREAIFLNLDTQEKVVQHYDLLHVTPYMNAAPVVRDCKELSNSEGYLEIDKFTLQHVRYPNVFGLGDCTNLPTSKTAAAVAGQFGVLRKNLGAVLDGKPMKGVYDGYTSCPLVTGKNSCILAEFDFSAPPKPLETFPVNQAKERSSMYLMKAHAMPFLYWQGMLRGFWEGPAIFRKAMRLGMSK